MSLFTRVFKIGQAEANAVVNKFEDPIKLTEQGIRDLKNDLSSAMQGLAEVKGLAIRLGKEAQDAQNQVGEYEHKAVLLLQSGQQGKMTAVDADRLATTALTQRDTIAPRAATLTKQAESQQQAAAKLQEKITQLRTTIQTYENELITLRARAQTAASTKKINQQLASVDSSSTVAMLERMKQKVDEDEALSEAYGEIAEQVTGASDVDAEINRALLTAGTSSGVDKLAELKAKMGILPATS